MGEQGRHPVNAPAPSRLEFVEGLPRAAHRAGIGAHELLAPVALLGDQASPLEHGDVLLHRREAHRVTPRESRNRGLVGGAAAKDVATGRVGQGMEQPVDRILGQLIYNHLVVGYRLPFEAHEIRTYRTTMQTNEKGSATVKLTTTTQVSVDGVMQGNGGRDETSTPDSSAADGLGRPSRCSTTRP
jgi:hypothetical protein